jgi:hypothetical protein
LSVGRGGVGGGCGVSLPPPALFIMAKVEERCETVPQWKLCGG